MHVKPFKKISNLNSVIEKANQGDGQSMIKLGIHYLWNFYDDFGSHGTYEDFIQAINWLEQATTKNLVEAYYWLGCAIDINRRSTSGGPYYVRGIQELPNEYPIVKRIRDTSPQESLVRKFLSFKWGFEYDEQELYRIAAENGIAEAQYNLGKILMNEWIHSSIYPDEKFNDELLEEAKDWLCKSAESGCPDAVEYLADLIRDCALEIRSLKKD